MTEFNTDEVIRQGVQTPRLGTWEGASAVVPAQTPEVDARADSRRLPSDRTRACLCAGREAHSGAETVGEHDVVDLEMIMSMHALFLGRQFVADRMSN